MRIKLIKFTTAICFSILAFAHVSLKAQVCTSAPIGLQTWYSADGNALDSRSRNNATLNNGATFTAGQVGQAFDFNGANDATAPDSPSLNFGTGSFSVETWVHPDSFPTAYDAVVTKGDAPATNRWQLFRGPAAFPGGANFPWRVNLVSGSTIINVQSDSDAQTGQWTHLAFVVDRANNLVKLYVNGVAQGSQSNLSSVGSFDSILPFRIGSEVPPSDSSYFDGQIDETSIYNRALSASEIQSIFNAGTAGKCKPTATTSPSGQVLWLAGDGNALDLSGNGNNGTLQNGATFAVAKVGQGFNLNGAADKVIIPNSPNIDFNANQNYSIEFWVKAGAQVGNNRAIIEKWDTNSGSYPYVVRMNQDGEIYAAVYDGVNAPGPGTGPGLNDNTWHHFAAIFKHSVKTIELYVDGQLRTSQTYTANLGTLANGLPVYFGIRSIFGETEFNGFLDEPAIYNRALSASEIQSIFNAGIAGKLKQNQTTDATNLVSLWQAEGNANDTRGTNNGTFTANTYAAGRIGQAFSFSSAPGVVVPDSPTLNTQNFTLEAFVTGGTYGCTSGPNTCEAFIIAKSGAPSQFGYEIGVWADGSLRYSLNGGAGGADLFSTSNIANGNFHHIAATYDGTAATPTMKIYIDGVLDAQKIVTATVNYQANSEFQIGSRAGGNNTTYAGEKIDEAAFYNRALTAAEIRANFQSGNALSTVVGDARVTSTTFPPAATVQQIPLLASLFPPLTMANPTGLVYDIATDFTASNPTVCFNLPSFTPAQFSTLRIFHLEGNEWQPRTTTSNTYPTLCTMNLPSLSPFAIGINAPTVASVSIGGRVRYAIGKGIFRAQVSLTDSSGNTRTTSTNLFGKYQFDDVPAGETYILSVSHRSIQFAQSTQVQFAGEDYFGIDFVAIE